MSKDTKDAKDTRGAGGRKRRTAAEVRALADAPAARERGRTRGAGVTGSGRGPRLGPTGIAALVYLVVVLLAFHAVVFGGLTFVSPDTTAPLGFVRVGEESLWKHGVYPLWNPYVFGGMPSFASGAYNPLIYPPDWPVALVQKVLPLPDVSWMLLYYFLAGLGTFILARHWGATQGGALVAGLAFMITPNLIANGAHGHGSQLVNEAYLPWMLWLTSRLWRDGRALDCGLLALLVGFQLLRGHVQIAYYAWLAIGLLSLFEFARRVTQKEGARQAGRSIMLLGVAMGLGFALSAFFSLPIREYAQHSIRGLGEGGGLKYDYATGWSFSPVETLTFLVPGALGFGVPTYWGTMPFTDFPNYMGLAILALAFLAVAAGRRAYHVGFLLVLGAFALLVSFGKHSAFYDFLFNNLPYFNKFRVPVMILVVFQLSVALLAGFGLTAVEDATRDPALRRRVFPWAAGVTALVALLWLTGLMPDVWKQGYEAAALASRPGMDSGAIEQGYRAMVGDIVRVALLALIALSAVLATLRGMIRPGVAAAIVGVITLIDLTVVNQRVLGPVLGPPRQLSAASERDDVIDFLVARKAEGEFRVLPVREFQSNRYAGFGIATLGGYHAAKTALFQRFLDADSGRAVQSPGAWRLLNVKYIIVPGLLPPEAGFREVFRGAEQVVYEFPGALPRATLVPAYRVAPRDSHLVVFRDPRHDAAQVTLLTEAPGIVPVPGGTARITEYGLNQVKVETETPGPSILRLADLDFPGWRVTIDGRPAKPLSADFLTRAVAVPAGRHVVVWEFHDPAFERGLTISIVAFVAILLLLLGSWWRGRRPRRSGAPAPGAAAPAAPAPAV
ncbi:MAG: hypothetical protein ABIP29_03030 [Candidatus Eisenbacteria bacterium]